MRRIFALTLLSVITMTGAEAQENFESWPRGILCNNGQWKSKDGTQSGTTPFRVFIKDGVRRASAG
jgi:hypothetical protein